MRRKTDTPSKVTAGLVQMSMSGNVDDNLKKAVDQIVKAAKKGAQVICLPELFKSRYFCQKEEIANFNLAETIPGPSTEKLRAAAKKYKIVIVASLFEKRTEGMYHNTVALINS